jgi:nucleoid-associated protein EbfC
MNMREMQRMQQKLMRMQEELELTNFVGTAGGGAVTITLTGKFEIVDVKIDPEAFSADEINELEAMVKAAAKDAFDKATDAQQKMISSATGGMRLPGF